MVYVTIGILTVAAIVFVARPMLSRHRYLYALESMFDFGDLRQRRFLESRKATILDNLKDLDFEYEMGKLSEEDYSRLRRDYLTTAQEAIQAIDTLKVREEIEELIERELQSRRRIK